MHVREPFSRLLKPCQAKPTEDDTADDVTGDAQQIGDRAIDQHDTRVLDDKRKKIGKNHARNAGARLFSK